MSKLSCVSMSRMVPVWTWSNCLTMASEVMSSSLTLPLEDPAMMCRELRFRSLTSSSIGVYCHQRLNPKGQRIG